MSYSHKFISAAFAAPMLAFYSKKISSKDNQAAECEDPEAGTRRAICILDPQPNQTASGVVRFE